jgi:uncharacterized membrane protein YfcA
MQERTARQNAIASVSGLLTGGAAGFIGVGGGELRIPTLVDFLKFAPPIAAEVNFLVGAFTVVLAVLRRWEHASPRQDNLMIAGIMGAASLAGAAVVVLWREKIPVRPLRAILLAYFVVVGVWMLYESVTHSEHVLLEPTGAVRWTMAAGIGFAIAVVSGVSGVAGGVTRIPALLYLFGVPIVDAGAVSLAVSIPTFVPSAFTDRRIGDNIPSSIVWVMMLMGAASAVGVLIGDALVPYAGRDLVKGALGVVLLLATRSLTVGSWH